MSAGEDVDGCENVENPPDELGLVKRHRGKTLGGQPASETASLGHRRSEFGDAIRCLLPYASSLCLCQGT